MMTSTTIKVQVETKNKLDLFREYKNESYDEVISKLVYIAKNAKENPELSKETILAIEKARERIKKGHYLTEEQAAKRLGF
jgi:predicted transcriptional regulator